jgi:hypothetical protein
VSKDELINQLPQLANVLETYKDYGSRTYEELFSKEQREGAVELKCTYLKSGILWKEENGFRLEALNQEVQISPVYSIIAEDIDNDGTSDLLLFGNLFGLKSDIGRLDGNRGVYLKGTPDRKYKSISSTSSGLFIRGQVRGAEMILDKEGDRKLILGRNNLPAKVYSIR